MEQEVWQKREWGLQQGCQTKDLGGEMWPAEALHPVCLIVGLSHHQHQLLSAAELCRSIPTNRVACGIIGLSHILKLGFGYLLFCHLQPVNP